MELPLGQKKIVIKEEKIVIEEKKIVIDEEKIAIEEEKIVVEEERPGDLLFWENLDLQDGERSSFCVSMFIMIFFGDSAVT